MGGSPIFTGVSIKTRKAILADKITIEQTIQDIKAKNQNGTWPQTADGYLAVSVPIRPADMKQRAALRTRLEAIDARLGVSKSRTNKPAIMADGASFAPTPDFLTEQMLAQRWHCSTSRLQRWRADQRGPAYLKIGGKVLYRLEDLREYEKARLFIIKGGQRYSLN